MTSALATMVPLDHIQPALVDDLLDRAFGPGRCERTAYRIREGSEWLPALSFALLQGEGRLIGSIQTWPVALTDAAASRTHPLLMVGPVAVHPDEQDKGHGRALMAALIQALEEPDASGEPYPPQILIGDPEYYGRFGFTAEHTGAWLVPGPYERHRLLARAAQGAALPREGTLGPWPG